MTGAKLVQNLSGEVITVWDGSRTVAKAKKMPSGGWQIRLYDACWLDPRARVPSKVTGTPFPEYLHLPDKRQAMKELNALLAQVTPW